VDALKREAWAFEQQQQNSIGQWCKHDPAPHRRCGEQIQKLDRPISEAQARRLNCLGLTFPLLDDRRMRQGASPYLRNVSLKLINGFRIDGFPHDNESVLLPGAEQFRCGVGDPLHRALARNHLVAIERVRPHASKRARIDSRRTRSRSEVPSRRYDSRTAPCRSRSACIEHHVSVTVGERSRRLACCTSTWNVGRDFQDLDVVHDDRR